MTIARISRILVVVGVLVIVAALALTYKPLQQNEPVSTTSGEQVVATVGCRSILLREIEQVVALPLYEADQQRNRLLHQALQRKIEETLLEAEASRKGVNVSQLLVEASQSETIARLANLPAPIKRMNSDRMQKDLSTSPPDDLLEQA